jgi:predicted metal-binding protein
MKCKVCDRETGKKEFCPSHLTAHENLTESYEIWRKALKIPWEEYLKEIKKNPLTGVWAKEVADYLINNEGTENGKES